VALPRTAKRVLIVEDDRATREIYRQALASRGFLVTAVEDGMDALRRIESERPDVVVLDLLLPRLGGEDVYLEMRANAATRAIPVVIVTGNDARQLEASELRYFLRKPVLPDALVAAVESAAASGSSPQRSEV